jgi:hypothetical protein
MKLCIDCVHHQMEVEWVDPDTHCAYITRKIVRRTCSRQTLISLVTGEPRPWATCEEERYTKNSACGQAGRFFSPKSEGK